MKNINYGVALKEYQKRDSFVEQVRDGIVYHVFKSSDAAWSALEKTHKTKDGWRIGCYGGYENCCWREV